MTGVYCFRNSTNGKVYVGSASSSVAGRKADHLYLLRRGEHHSPHFQAAWNLYGADVFQFSVLEECGPDDCLTNEQKWIDSLGAADPERGYNVATVAGSRRGVPSPEVADANRQRTFGEADRERLSRQASFERSDETRAKMAAAKKKWWSDRSNREKMSAATTTQWEERRMKNADKSITDADMVRSVWDGTKMTVEQFGAELLKANDLDPVYVLLHEAREAGDLYGFARDRFLIAYFCFYHIGTAAWIVGSDCYGEDYWTRFEAAARSKDYPRSAERRHFRGDNAMKCFAYLRERGTAALMDDIMRAGLSAAELMAAVRQWVGFGPWISFKVADMVERLGIRPVEFDADTAMYEGSPTEAAHLLWDVMNPGLDPNGEPGGAEAWAVDFVLAHLAALPAHDLPPGRRLAPPRYDRALNAQEAETVLCKWKSYLGGHYHVGEDVAACRRALIRFPRVRLSQQLLQAGKRGGLW